MRPDFAQRHDRRQLEGDICAVSGSVVSAMRTGDEEDGQGDLVLIADEPSGRDEAGNPSLGDVTAIELFGIREATGRVQVRKRGDLTESARRPQVRDWRRTE